MVGHVKLIALRGVSQNVEYHVRMDAYVIVELEHVGLHVQVVVVEQVVRQPAPVTVL